MGDEEMGAEKVERLRRLRGGANERMGEMQDKGDGEMSLQMLTGMSQSQVGSGTLAGTCAKSLLSISERNAVHTCCGIT